MTVPIRFAALVAGVALLAGACGTDSPEADAPPVFALERQVADEIVPVDPNRTDVMAAPVLRSLLQSLLTEHSDLSIVTMRQTVDGAHEAQTRAALTDNTDRLALAIGVVYGPDGASAFDQLWTNHIQFFDDYASAVGRGDRVAADEAVGALSHYENDFSSLVDVATSGAADFHDVLHVLHSHVDQLLTQADAWAAGDHAEAYRLAGVAHRHMDDIAVALATGIAVQQPEAFPGPVGDEAATVCARAQLDDSQLLAARVDVAAAAFGDSDEARAAAERALDAVLSASGSTVASGETVERVEPFAARLDAAATSGALSEVHREVRPELRAALAADPACAGLVYVG